MAPARTKMGSRSSGGGGGNGLAAGVERVVPPADPFGARGQVGGPGARAGRRDRRDEQVRADHEVVVLGVRGGIGREVVQGRSLHGRSGGVGLVKERVQIRHEPIAQADVVPADVLDDGPEHPRFHEGPGRVAVVAEAVVMLAAEGREHAGLHPAGVQFGGGWRGCVRVVEEAADVVPVVRVARDGHGQAHGDVLLEVVRPVAAVIARPHGRITLNSGKAAPA